MSLALLCPADALATPALLCRDIHTEYRRFLAGSSSTFTSALWHTAQHSWLQSNANGPILHMLVLHVQLGFDP